ncbi:MULTISPECIES: DUF1702 family protein [unclassified Novosphingobium]|uniref:DUF1702 family protein n=1 Tax=unclassified Novosphingobium TaxID=2644732 RepID=UPI0025D5F316|nr:MULTISPECIES: DUF1702 family protein [unclassified Novosphingobium]HQV04670.1 DUF1702 family protein [Novosphingobium sp.]
MLTRALKLRSDAASSVVLSLHNGPATAKLEAIGTTFVDAFNAYMDDPRPKQLAGRIQATATELQGFYAEGTTMAAAIAATVLPWGNRLGKVLAELEPRFVHLAHVGAGWALARVGIAGAPVRRQLDPGYLGLAWDGYGFHETFFSRRNWQQARGKSQFEAQAYYQGVGRALWFRSGGDCAHLIQSLEQFPERWKSDLWSGVGLASCYAGPASNSTAGALKAAAGEHLGYLRQGAAFAVSAFARAGHQPEHCIATASALTGKECRGLTAMVEDHRLAAFASKTDGLAGYHLWRDRIATTLEGT